MVDDHEEVRHELEAVRDELDQVRRLAGAEPDRDAAVAGARGRHSAAITADLLAVRARWERYWLWEIAKKQVRAHRERQRQLLEQASTGPRVRSERAQRQRAEALHVETAAVLSAVREALGFAEHADDERVIAEARRFHREHAAVCDWLGLDDEADVVAHLDELRRAGGEG
ncbi:hypothetical protein SAMN06265360_12637 [Haloechinothrix alba]|uniref:Uncharacterized protein n=1 Tax=Haloechinothrix alba TaxID=664784 RepID=A0A238ZW61_9PSEU|nr:hypothetical protein [Haloechinothrix alba]SNR87479.1 hypothetical protein SAMN06265360_12637 [Haloechinothrix alba]